jgi:hypothetical protein
MSKIEILGLSLLAFSLLIVGVLNSGDPLSEAEDIPRLEKVALSDIQIREIARPSRTVVSRIFNRPVQPVFEAAPEALAEPKTQITRNPNWLSYLGEGEFEGEVVYFFAEKLRNITLILETGKVKDGWLLTAVNSKEFLLEFEGEQYAVDR